MCSVRSALKTCLLEPVEGPIQWENYAREAPVALGRGFGETIEEHVADDPPRPIPASADRGHLVGIDLVLMEVVLNDSIADAV